MMDEGILAAMIGDQSLSSSSSSRAESHALRQALQSQIPPSHSSAAAESPIPPRGRKDRPITTISAGGQEIHPKGEGTQAPTPPLKATDSKGRRSGSVAVGRDGYEMDESRTTATAEENEQDRGESSVSLRHDPKREHRRDQRREIPNPSTPTHQNHARSSRPFPHETNTSSPPAIPYTNPMLKTPIQNESQPPAGPSRTRESVNGRALVSMKGLKGVMMGDGEDLDDDMKGRQMEDDSKKRQAIDKGKEKDKDKRGQNEEELSDDDEVVPGSESAMDTDREDPDDDHDDDENMEKEKEEEVGNANVNPNGSGTDRGRIEEDIDELEESQPHQDQDKDRPVTRDEDGEDSPAGRRPMTDGEARAGNPRMLVPASNETDTPSRSSSPSACSPPALPTAGSKSKIKPNPIPTHTTSMDALGLGDEDKLFSRGGRRGTRERGGSKMTSPVKRHTGDHGEKRNSGRSSSSNKSGNDRAAGRGNDLEDTEDDDNSMISTVEKGKKRIRQAEEDFQEGIKATAAADTFESCGEHLGGQRNGRQETRSGKRMNGKADLIRNGTRNGKGRGKEEGQEVTHVEDTDVEPSGSGSRSGSASGSRTRSQSRKSASSPLKHIGDNTDDEDGVLEPTQLNENGMQVDDEERTGEDEDQVDVDEGERKDVEVARDTGGLDGMLAGIESLGTPDAASTPWHPGMEREADQMGEEPDTSGDGYLQQQGSKSDISESSSHHRLPLAPKLPAVQALVETGATDSSKSRLTSLKASRRLGRTARPSLPSPLLSAAEESINALEAHQARTRTEIDSDDEPQETYQSPGGPAAKESREAAPEDIAETEQVDEDHPAVIPNEEDISVPQDGTSRNSPAPSAPVPAKRGRKRKAAEVVASPEEEPTRLETPDAINYDSLPIPTPRLSNPNVYGKNKPAGRVRKPTQKASDRQHSDGSSSSSEPEDEDDSTWRPKAGPNIASKLRLGKELGGNGKAPVQPKARGAAKEKAVAAAPSTTSGSRSESPAPRRGIKRKSEGAGPIVKTKKRKSTATVESGSEADMLDVIDQPTHQPMTQEAQAAPVASPVEENRRVFAPWTDGHLYSGRAIHMGAKASIAFDDGSYRSVTVRTLHQCRLQVKDVVGRVNLAKKEADLDWIVTKAPTASADHSADDIISLKLANDPKFTRQEPVRHLRIRKKDIQQMRNRELEDDHSNLLNEHAQVSETAKVRPPSPTRTNASSAAAAEKVKIRPRKKARTIGTAFAGMGFLMSKQDNVTTAHDINGYKDRIVNHGGFLGDDIWDFYNKPNPEHGFDSLHLKDEHAELQAIFLLVPPGTPVMTTKVMMALAIGIPLIAYDYLADAYNQNVPWQSYLICSGRSEYLRSPCSQVIHHEWGKESGAVGAALEGMTERRPFAGSHVMVVKTDGVHDIVPYCACAMGAESVTVVNKLTTDTDLENPDYVIISDRSKPPSALCNNPKIVNVEYMKQCLIVGRALPKKCYIKPEAQPQTPTKVR